MKKIKPALFLLEHWPLLKTASRLGPVLDLACGTGHNGVFLASKGISVILIDRNQESLQQARELARQVPVTVDIRRLDLELPDTEPLCGLSLGGAIIFRYLYRPLIPALKKAVQVGGVVVYETFTIHQLKFGKPHNPDFLLQPGELKQLFSDWEILHYYEGVEEEPQRAFAQIVCRKKKKSF